MAVTTAEALAHHERMRDAAAQEIANLRVRLTRLTKLHQQIASGRMRAIHAQDVAFASLLSQMQRRSDELISRQADTMAHLMVTHDICLVRIRELEGTILARSA